MFAARRHSSALSHSAPAPKLPAVRVHRAAQEHAWRKLATAVPVSQPHDPAEHEADRVADAVIRGDAAKITSGGEGVQRMCAGCEEEQRREEDAGAIVQAKFASGSSAQPASLAQPLSTGGVPLPAGLRGFYEPRLGTDLGDVRVHTGPEAADSARRFNASAYTFGTHVVFGAGQYEPDSRRGRHLLAHELAHVVQQSGQVRPMVQRQIPIPIFDEFDPCIITPQGKLCGSDAKKACEKIPAIPGCKALCKKLGCKKPEKKGPGCPPGWRAAGSKDFEGQCCRGTIDNARDCCPPARIALLDFRCCGPDEAVIDNRCQKKPEPPETKKCPPEQQAWGGRCCEPPLQPEGFACVEPQKPPPKDKPPKPPVVHDVLRIEFKKDAPQTWYDPSASFRVSVTADGQRSFESLVLALKADAKLKVELAGHASIEKPADDPGYNDRLSERRARVVLSELEKRGVDGARLGSPPNAAAAAGCRDLSAGLLACGDEGASATPSPQDRNVTASTFAPAE